MKNIYKVLFWILLLFLSTNISFWQIEVEYQNIGEISNNWDIIKTSYKTRESCNNSIFSLLWLNLFKNETCSNTPIIPTTPFTISFAVSSYPLCNQNDMVAPNWITISSCDVWETTFWSWLVSKYFQWWQINYRTSSSPISSSKRSGLIFDWMRFSNDNSIFYEGDYTRWILWEETGMYNNAWQYWPCASWYHIPSSLEWYNFLKSIWVQWTNNWQENTYLNPITSNVNIYNHLESTWSLINSQLRDLLGLKHWYAQPYLTDTQGTGYSTLYWSRDRFSLLSNSIGGFQLDSEWVRMRNTLWSARAFPLRCFKD